MAEYIERKRVLADISKFIITKSAADFTHYEEGRDEAIADVLKTIEKLPTADVRPERHGEWLVSGECYECSECGGGSTVNTNPYCWKCGAMMDGKDGESDG
ncbi:MAG: hypothetical protein K2O14_03585 [Oscillospiraceae bacterium]|nr:hypothetical protein [Oscillospiraceae bacterium]